MNTLASNLLPCFSKIQLQQSGPGEERISRLSTVLLKFEEIELVQICLLLGKDYLCLRNYAGMSILRMVISSLYTNLLSQNIVYFFTVTCILYEFSL